MDSFLLQTVIYLPFFAFSYYFYYYGVLSQWKGKFIECLVLANGFGAFFMFIIGNLVFSPFHIDVVTLASIIITGLDSFYTSYRNKSQKPEIIEVEDSTEKS